MPTQSCTCWPTKAKHKPGVQGHPGPLCPTLFPWFPSTWLWSSTLFNLELNLQSSPNINTHARAHAHALSNCSTSVSPIDSGLTYSLSFWTAHCPYLYPLSQAISMKPNLCPHLVNWNLDGWAYPEELILSCKALQMCQPRLNELQNAPG